MGKLNFLLMMTFLVTLSANAEASVGKADYNVVPLPSEVRLIAKAPFVLNGDTKIIFHNDNADIERNAHFLAQYIKDNTGIDIGVTSDNAKQAIYLVLNKKIIGDDAYTITVSSKAMTIAGSTPRGVFYGIQTLRKATPVADTITQVEYPAGVVSDSPRFGYRGMHLDCARHFFPVKFVKQYIDMMALHGMNVFHWHLTDDQGWRIEIKKYPKLTEIGSVRLQTVLGRNSDIYDGKPYTGFYTQDDAREIVRYAAERYITVIPEIDMPGHMEAALTAYPELGCTGGPYQVIQEWGVFPDILCAGKENTFQFMEDVISELIDIFPAKYFHIGGDEALKKRWQKCPDCQKRIKEQQIVADNKVSAEDKLQGYFTNRVEKFLNDHGRQLIGWDEILGSEVNQSATIMSWRGAEPGAVAARQGHDVIMAPTTYCYFDYYQTDNQRNEPLLIGGNVPIEKTYNFEPVDSTLTPEEAKHIIGVQANLWTEYIDAKQLVEYQVLPRMGALSEIQWMQPEKKNFEQFKSRLGNLVKIYDRYGWVYARHLWKDKKDVQ